jgi:hypothetical protein
MKLRVFGVAAVLSLSGSAAAYAGWMVDDHDDTKLDVYSYDIKATSIGTPDSESGLWYLTFRCSGGILGADYSIVAPQPSDLLPADASVRLAIAAKGAKRVSFAVVRDDADGSVYRLGNSDAPALLAQVQTGKPFAIDLRIGTAKFWAAQFGNENYAVVKGGIEEFCPSPTEGDE